MPHQRRNESAPPARPAERRTRRIPRGLLVGIIVADTLLFAAFLGWWFGLRRPAADEGRPLNVILITLDTTRADHLGCYGHRAAATPNLDALAAGGTRFAYCTSAAPSTLPSHATILTGAYPFVHGVRDNVDYRLSEANTTLAEVLSAAGYDTAAFVAAFVVGRDTGLDQGFNVYDDAGRQHERPANEVCDRALAWLHDRGNGPFFMWLHLYDPHFPYEPPARFSGRYDSPYTGEIAFADEQVGRLLAELRTRELDEHTLIVVTADHGEGLGQHDEQTHLFFVYDTTMWVPLILHGPALIPDGKTIATPVRTVDIAPTILALLGHDPSALPETQGRDLSPALRGAALAAEPAYGEALGGQIVLGTAALRCVWADGWKYIHAPRPELYHITDDPDELDNRAANESDRVAQLRDELQMIIAAAPQAPDDARVRLDPATRERLASLGYVGGDEPAAGPEIEHLVHTGPDPKDHGADFEAVGQAMDLMQTGRPAEAEALYERLVATFPDVLELRLQHARAIFLQQRIDDAIDVYRGLLERWGDDARVHYGLAKLLERAGQRTAALDHFAIAARLNPDDPAAHFDLGVALDKAGRREEALMCYRAALAARASYVDARVNLAIGLAALGRFDEAIAEYRRALHYAPDDATIHYNLGNALLRSGDAAGAVAAYEAALRLAPDFAPAREALDFARRQAGAAQP